MTETEKLKFRTDQKWAALERRKKALEIKDKLIRCRVARERMNLDPKRLPA